MDQEADQEADQAPPLDRPRNNRKKLQLRLYASAEAGTFIASWYTTRSQTVTRHFHQKARPQARTLPLHPDSRPQTTAQATILSSFGFHCSTASNVPPATITRPLCSSHLKRRIDSINLIVLVTTDSYEQPPVEQRHGKKCPNAGPVGQWPLAAALRSTAHYKGWNCLCTVPKRGTC